MNAFAGMIPQQAISIMETLTGSGFEAYLVGGCVRDLLLGRAPSDYDITTQAEPCQVRELFSSYHLIDVGAQHGTMGIVMDGQVFEVTTYRVDGEYSDNRRPDSVTFTRSLEEDLKRRDFTVNALAMDAAGQVVDLVGGMADLHAKKLRAVGEPSRRFREDALRIMRFLRFQAQLGFSADPETAVAARELGGLLEHIAPERLQVELNKLLMAESGAVVASVLREYREVIAVFLPEIREGFDFDQQNPFHAYDVWEHILHAVEETPRDKIIRLAALLHDVGKPACFVLDREWGHFYGHEHKSAEMAETALKRLRYDKTTLEAVVDLIRIHGTVFQLNAKYARRKLNQLGETRLRQLIALEKADVSAQAESVRAERRQNMDDFLALVEEELAKDACFSLKDLKVNGHDLMEAGVPAGPQIGRLLNKLLDAVMNEEIPNERDLLLKAIRKYLEINGQ